MLLRLKHTVRASRAFVNPHGIWLALHPAPTPAGMAGGSFLECTRLLQEGSVALRVGEYAQAGRGVYLVEGAPVILDERELEPVKGRGK